MIQKRRIDMQQTGCPGQAVQSVAALETTTLGSDSGQ